MYRIHFVPQCSKFCIQVRVFGMFWRTVRVIKKHSHKPCYFPTFEATVMEIQDLGLDKLYRDGSENKFRQYMDKAVDETVIDDKGN
jgi:hypothetical protein